MIEGDRAKVLLVDDRVENLIALEAILAPFGQELVRATSGVEALRKLLADDFALILLDVEMPGLNGFETADYVKQRQRTEHTPIIFLTAVDPTQQLLTQAYEAGGVDYLFKPFDPVVLRSKVQVFLDLWRLRREAEQLAHRALHDALTGLPNRTLFLDRLDHALAGLDRNDATLAVLFLDLDGFKAVNDGLGHEAGDQLLVEVTRRICGVMRPTDTLARLGGDEFVILCENVGDAAGGRQVANRVAQAIAPPVALGDASASVRVSIGISLRTGPAGNQSATLLREADAAMYRAKAKGLGGHEVYDTAMRAQQAQQVGAERALQAALADGSVRIVYQPIVAVVSGQVEAMEALVRWQHPEQGLLEPAAFLPLAEQTGLIVPLGRHVLRQACMSAQDWQERFPGVGVAVNLSARELAQAALPAAVRTVLAETGLDPRLLTLEISERGIGDLDAFAAALDQLAGLGVRLAVDNFGNGSFSLGTLRRCPVDVVKIDRPLLRDLGDDKYATAVVAALVSLAQLLGLQIVAGGVENARQLDALRTLGCDAAQGYELCRPQPVEIVRQWLATRPRHLGMVA